MGDHHIVTIFKCVLASLSLNLLHAEVFGPQQCIVATANTTTVIVWLIEWTEVSRAKLIYVFPLVLKLMFVRREVGSNPL